MKKYKYILKYIILFIAILIFNMLIVPTDLDEIWSYGFSISMRNGLVPYRDFNMVVTPIYPFIISIFLFIFGKNILIFHIIQALIITIMSSFLFKLIGNKSWLLLLIMFFPIPIFFPGYNILLFFFLILLIYLEKEKYSDLIIGIVIGLSFLTKQSVGILFIIPSIIYYFKDIKKIGFRLLGFIIPNIIFLIYLLITNSFYKFIDLCFLGLFDFADSNGNIFSIYFFLMIIITIITIYYLYKNKKDINLLYILMFYSVAVPMFDIKHFMEAFMGFVFIFLYYEKVKIKPEYAYFLLFSLIVIIQSIVIFNDRINSKILYPNNIKYFEYRLIEKENIKITHDVNNFIDKNNYNKFIFLDSNSFYFKIINDHNIEYLDLLNTGNWGYNGTSKLLNEIKTKKDYVFFIDKEELKRGKQTDKMAIKYVMDNGKKIDSISFYDVYILD